MATCAQVQADDSGFGLIVSGFSSSTYGDKCEVPWLGSQQDGECWFFGGGKVFDRRLAYVSRKKYSLAANFVYAQLFPQYQ
jgi:hypothetical protein